MPRNILDQNWFDFFNKNGLQWQEGSLFDKNFTADQVGNLYSIAGNVAGTAGDVVNDISNQYYTQNAGRADLANTVSGNSWGDVFSNDDKLSQGLQNIDAGITDVSNINNLDTLQNITINQQDEVNDSVEVGSIVGSTLGDAAKGAAAGSMFGPVGMLVGGAAGLIEGGARSVVSAIQHNKNAKIENAAIRRANRQSVNNYYNQANNIAQRQQRQAMMNYFDNGGSLEGLNGVTEFNVGNSHENNPYGGIQQGIASDNLPNLVEEGELKYNDYIYSARLKPSKSLLKKYILPEKYADKTFAEIGDKLQKESEERPNDPVSKTTLDEWMLRLQNAQEEYKAKAEERRLAKVVDSMSDEEKTILLSSLEQPMAQQEGIDLSQPMYAKGGKIYIKPENRGKFTALKKRTGKSASWFKAHGTPAQKKMATFALNARKWKHEDGGHLAQWGLELDIPSYQDTSSPYYGLEVLDSTPTQPIALNTSYLPIWKEDNTVPLYLLGKEEANADLNKAIESAGRKAFGDMTNEQIDSYLATQQGNKSYNLENLRYAPAIGAGIGALTAALQPKDYDLANRYRSIAASFRPISASHIGGYRKYTPYDVNLGDAENLALQTAALNANRGQNRATQGALNTAILAKSQEASAKRNLAAQQANEANRLAVDTYNLGIDQFNAQRDSQYDQLNQQILTNKLNMLGKAAEAEDASKTAWANMYNATHENLYNQLGNVGRDEWNRNRALTYLEEHPEIFTDEYLNKLGFIRK